MILPHYEVDADHVKVPAGWMIERCGWKGKAMGPAAVHDKQALVLVNLGGAKGADIVKLSEAVQASVREKFGIDIRPDENFVLAFSKRRIFSKGDFRRAARFAVCDESSAADFEKRPACKKCARRSVADLFARGLSCCFDSESGNRTRRRKRLKKMTQRQCAIF